MDEMDEIDEMFRYPDLPEQSPEPEVPVKRETLEISVQPVRPVRSASSESRAIQGVALKYSDAHESESEGSADEGQMQPVVWGASKPDSPTTCSSCGDIASVLYQCASPGCTHRICVQKRGYQLPCINEESIQVPPSEFKCPLCLNKLKKPVPYEIQSQPINYLEQQVIATPLSIYCLVFGHAKETWPASLLLSNFRQEYGVDPTRLETAVVRMKIGASAVQKIGKTQRSLRRTFSINPGSGKFLMFMDTHSDYDTGWVAYGIRKSDGARLVEPVPEIVRRFMGKALTAEVAASKGLKGLVLLTCGAAFTDSSHFQALKGMVDENIFTFILGFSGTSVVPKTVMLAVAQFLMDAFMHNDSLWDSLVERFLNHRLLTHTPVVFIYRDPSQENVVIARQLIYSTPRSRPWGLFPRCGIPTCRALPGSFSLNGGKKQGNNHPGFKVKCLLCGWSSEYVLRPSWIHELPKKFFFWHHFPLAPQERQYILYESHRILAERGGKKRPSYDSRDG